MAGVRQVVRCCEGVFPPHWGWGLWRGSSPENFFEFSSKKCRVLCILGLLLLVGCGQKPGRAEGGPKRPHGELKMKNLAGGVQFPNLSQLALRV